MNQERKMFTGNWPCGGCDATITELPFQPDPSRLSSLKCRDCYRKEQGERSERKMFEGNWKCAECDEPITSLPFEPRDESNLKCRDCFRK